MSESASGSSLRPRLSSSADEQTVERDGLDLLSDDCATRILSMVADESAPARQISRRLDVSRATVYRRLDRLEEAGLVASSVTYDPDGHHRRVYRAAVAEVTVAIDGDGVAVESVESDADQPAVFSSD
ncbi:MAG: ArsR/SmtB family transcription factor [Halobaculum sp.]